MAGPLGRLFLLFSLFSTLFLLVNGKPAKRIIDDDDLANPALGSSISFLPAKNGNWNDGRSCTPGSAFCLGAVDPSLCQNGTYTATTTGFSSNGRSIVIEFFGDDISIFFSLVGAGPSSLSTRCTFVLDNGEPKTFEHIPTEAATPGSIQYRRNVFNTEGGLLAHGRHRLEIAVSPATYLNFDYAEYGFDDELPFLPPTSTGSATATVTVTVTPTSSGSSQGTTASQSNGPSDGVFKAAIIGGSISGTIVVVAVVLFLIYRSRLRKQKQPNDGLTFGVPSTYAGSTRKLSLPFWPNGPIGDNTSQLRNLTPLPEKRSSYGTEYYTEKYDDEYVSSPPQARSQLRDRTSTMSQGPMLSPANALIQSFYPNDAETTTNKRGSATTGKLSRLEDNLSPVSNFPRRLQRFSEVRTQQATDSGGVGTISSSNVLPLSPDSSAGRPAQGSYYAV